MHSSCTQVASIPEVVFPVLDLPKLELCFKDGTTVWLRQISADVLQRSVADRGELLQVDLRRLAPLLEDEVFQAAPHDQPGVIFFTLRHCFKNAEAFIEAVRQLHSGKGGGLPA